MEQRTYFREFIKYSFFNVLGMLGFSFYILADTFFIAKGVGANGLTALNLAIPAYSLMHSFALMFSMGSATKYSIYKSQNKHQKANQLFTSMMLVATICSLLFMAAGLFFSAPITSLLGADGHVFAMTNIYLKIILFFSPAFIWNEILVAFVRNDGQPKLAMKAMLLGSLSNILFDYIFIFPLHLGIFGAVLATGFSPLISMLIISPYLLRKNAGFHFVRSKFVLQPLFSSFSLGFPSLVSELSSGIVIMIFNIIILGLLGNVGVAAYGIIANISLVVVSVYTGIAGGVQPLISSAYGYGDTKKIRLLFRYAMSTMSIISVLVYCAIYFLAEPITTIFNSEHNSTLQEIAVYGLKIYFTAVLFVGFNIILSVFFTATEKAAPAHIISLMRGLLVIVPMTFLFSAFWEITGVWLSFPATEFLVALLGTLIYRKVFRR